MNTENTEAAKAAEGISRYVRPHESTESYIKNLTAIIQASNEAYAAARTRELMEVLGRLLYQYETGGCDANAPSVSQQARALLATHQPTKEA